MFYVIIEQGDISQIPIENQVFKTEVEADIERIYLQPDYDNLLNVVGII